MLAVLQGPGLSPDQLWGDLMGLAVHQLLSMYHRVTLPWGVGTDSGVKSWRPVETCQISPVKTQRCGLQRCVFLRLDMRTLWISSLSWFFSFKGGKWSREKDEKNWGRAEADPRNMSGTPNNFCWLFPFVRCYQPAAKASLVLPGPAVIRDGFWLDPGDGGFRAWLCPETLIEVPMESRVQRYPMAIAWKCQAYIS